MIIPYVSIMKINESIKLLSKNKTPPVYRNVRPSLLLLDFIDKKDILTTKGSLYAAALFKDDRTSVQEILSGQLKKIELFQTILKNLELTGKLTILEIGNLIKEKYNKIWQENATHAYGKSCASIISYSGMAYLYGDMLSIHGEDLYDEPYPQPDATYNQLRQTLEALHKLGTSDSKEIKKEVTINIRKLPSVLNTATALGLTHRFSRSIYGISKLGEKMIDPALSQKERLEKFGEIILKSPYKILIQNFENRPITSTDVGEKICYDLKKDWSSLAIKQAGNRFLNLLKETNLVKKESKKYFIKIPESKTEKISDSDRIFHLGRIIEKLESSIEVKDEVRFVSAIKEIGNMNIFSEDVLSLVNQHFKLYISLGEPKIIESDIALIKNRIKEKLTR